MGLFICDIHTVVQLPVIKPWPPIISASKLLYSAWSTARCGTREVWQHLLLHASKLQTGKINPSTYGGFLDILSG